MKTILLMAGIITNQGVTIVQSLSALWASLPKGESNIMSTETLPSFLMVDVITNHFKEVIML